MSMRSHLFTSESVCEGHPDKVCDLIADSILDAYIEKDPLAHVACEVLVKSDLVVLAGEISSRATVDRPAVARRAIREVGYVDPAEPFHADGVRILEHVGTQAAEISDGVGGLADPDHEQGAGDQGLMFGYATDETQELMPLPVSLAHRLARRLAEDRKSGRRGWLRPDGKTQVTVRYENGAPREVTSVLVSMQHAPTVRQDEIREYVERTLVPDVIGSWKAKDATIIVNPAGSFEQGGPSADAGVTGRKIIVDTYGGMARHGGGAFSGKDPSKVDRSAAYFCRYAARQIVKKGLARRAEIQVAYAIGMAKPMSVKVDTFGTGDDAAAEAFLFDGFDFRPAKIIDRLGLLRPIYRQTTNYGHFGRPGLPWEE